MCRMAVAGNALTSCHCKKDMNQAAAALAHRKAASENVMALCRNYKKNAGHVEECLFVGILQH